MNQRLNRTNHLNNKRNQSPYKFKTKIYKEKSLIQLKKNFAQHMNMNFQSQIYLKDQMNLKIPQAKSSFFNLQKEKIFYGVNTINGIIRNYNEDRVSIVTNIKAKNNEQQWPQLSYFSIYDGHGGAKCSDFLKNNLHKNLIKNQFFPSNIKKALYQACIQTENIFLDLAKNRKKVEKSGSCGIILLTKNDKCYIANIGDSRIFVSENKGRKIFQISKDHKPNNKQEKQRIISNGGKVKQNQKTLLNNMDNIQIPFRVYPGGLSVTRSFGDIAMKDLQMGGNPNLIIATPDIFEYTIHEKTDFFLMGCDGIFDNLNNIQISSTIWNFIKQRQKLTGLKKSFNEKVEQIVNLVIKKAIDSQSVDNLTCIFIPINKRLFEQLIIN